MPQPHSPAAKADFQTIPFMGQGPMMTAANHRAGN